MNPGRNINLTIPNLENVDNYISQNCNQGNQRGLNNQSSSLRNFYSQQNLDNLLSNLTVPVPICNTSCLGGMIPSHQSNYNTYNSDNFNNYDYQNNQDIQYDSNNCQPSTISESYYSKFQSHPDIDCRIEFKYSNNLPIHTNNYRSGILKIGGSNLSIFAGGLESGSAFENEINPCISGIQKGYTKSFNCALLLTLESFYDTSLSKQLIELSDNSSTIKNHEFFCDQQYTGLIEFNIICNKIIGRLVGDLKSAIGIRNYGKESLEVNLEKDKKNDVKASIVISGTIDNMTNYRIINFETIKINIVDPLNIKQLPSSDFTNFNRLCKKILNENSKDIAHNLQQIEKTVKKNKKDKQKISDKIDDIKGKISES